MHQGPFQSEYELLSLENDPIRRPIGSKHDEGRPTFPRRWPWRTGWKTSQRLASLGCVIVLAFNLGFLLWAVARHRLHDGRGVLHEGNCSQVREMSTGLHLLINILGTILLGASNYGMQCLCAPTRKDIDKVHANGRWLDIGVPSPQNLIHLPWKRGFLWFCLTLSSLPLHIVYNSTIFSTTSANAYNIFVGNGAPDQQSLDNLTLTNMAGDDRPSFLRLQEKAHNGTLQRLDISKCLDTYATTYQTNYGSLILVSDNVNATTYDKVDTQPVYSPFETLFNPEPTADPYRWICPEGASKSCSVYLPDIRDEVQQNAWDVHPWSESGYQLDKSYRVNYCLIEELPQHCKLQYSLPLTIVVIVFNLIKAVIMCYMTFSMTDSPILTTGDAVASFFKEPDESSRGKCWIAAWEVNLRAKHKLEYEPLSFTSKRMRWGSAVSQRKWILGIFVWAAGITTCAALISYASGIESGAIWGTKFGSIGAQTLIKANKWPTDLISNTIIANIPQLLFSMLYFLLNAILTGMTLAAEWSRYALSHRGLRVSDVPRDAQRASYFLSLPYRYAIPLMSASALLHWLISQSLFLVGIEAYTPNLARSPDRDLMTCGFSPIAIVSAIAVGVVMIVTVIGLGRKRLASAMPVAGSCSLAIAAACHPSFNPNRSMRDQKIHIDTEMEFEPVRWGTVPVDGVLGHLTFSSGEVGIPEEGGVYK